MADWKNILKAYPIDWLIEDIDPSVRYFTLKDILGLPDDDPHVYQTKHEIMHSCIVPDILGKMNEPSYKQDYPRFYTNKYKGLVWQTIVLAELGVQANMQIKDQCEYLFSNSQEFGDGGFSMHTNKTAGGGRITEVIPCLTGNMVWSLIRLGYFEDPRLQKALRWIEKFMVYNDGAEDTPQIEPYNRYEICWGKHTCHMGVVKALKALSAVPPEKRTDKINEAIYNASEFMLIHHIFKQSHNLSRVSKPGWLKFGFPLMYQADVLEILDILTALGIKDNRMTEAMELVISKQDDTGRWITENTYGSDRLLVPHGAKRSAKQMADASGTTGIKAVL